MTMQLRWRDYIGVSVFYLVVLFVIFLAIDIFHFNYFRPHIVLHGMMMDMGFTILITVLLVRLLPALPFHAILLTNASIIFLFIASLYSVLGPVMCDRSLSVFILQKLEEASDAHKTLTVPELVALTQTHYIQGSHMVEKRLAEQQATGAINIQDDKITLTPGGILAAQIFEFFYKVYGIPKDF